MCLVNSIIYIYVCFGKRDWILDFFIMTTFQLLTSHCILVMALHSNIFILFFPTNNSVGYTRLFWNQLLFSVENKHLFAFLSRRFTLNLLVVFKLFLQSPSGPSFLCLQLDPQEMEHQKHAVSESHWNCSGTAHFPYKSTLLRCNDLFTELSWCYNVLLEWFPNSVPCGFDKLLM